MPNRRRAAVFLTLLCMTLASAARAANSSATPEGRIIYAINFGVAQSGSALDWLEQSGFEFMLDARDLNPHFSNDSLVLETNRATAGLFAKKVHLPEAKRIRVFWGVDRYPHGADWENGIYRVPIAVMVSYGHEKVASGAFYLPDSTYFTSLFLSDGAREGKAYIGNYYKQGGRYFCTPCGAPTGKTVIAEFDLELAFKKEFHQSMMPAVTGFGFQMNTKDTQGGARAFLKRVEFLSN